MIPSTGTLPACCQRQGMPAACAWPARPAAVRPRMGGAALNACYRGPSARAHGLGGADSVRGRASAAAGRCARPCHRGRAPATLRPRVILSAKQDDDGGDATLLADIEFMRQKEGKAVAPESRVQPTNSEEELTPMMKLSKVLVADFFFVLFALAWFLLGLVLNSVKHSEVLDAWVALWPFVFQPAIGALMAGSLLTGAVSWYRENVLDKQ